MNEKMKWNDFYDNKYMCFSKFEICSLFICYAHLFIGK